MVEQVMDKNIILAIVIRNKYSEPGINFFTPNNFSQQIAYMKHLKGKIIEPHLHNSVRRDVFITNEVLFIKKGILRVDFYTEYKIYLESRTLRAGDAILLAAGGHGFEVLEEVEMIEVKQGPYAGDGDKTRFAGISVEDVKLAPDNA